MIVNIDNYSIAELIEMKFGLKKGQEFKLMADPILHKYYADKADEDDITYCVSFYIKMKLITTIGQNGMALMKSSLN